MLLDDQGLPILTQFSEDGFVDCVFKVDSLKADEDFYFFNLLASHNTKTVGFAVKLIKSIRPGFDGDMNLIKGHVYYRGVSFRSLGRVSDDLVTALANLYAMDAVVLKMVAEESFTAIALQQTNTDLETDSVKIKLFGRDSEPFSEDDYYESFFNIDLPSRVAYWNEKDEDYRAPLIRAFSAL